MDRKLSKSQEIERLIRLSEASRSTISVEAQAFRQRFNVPARIRQSISQHPTGWLIGSLISGLASSLLFQRKSKPLEIAKSRGLPLTLAGLILTAARPLVKIWLTGQAKTYLTGRLASFSSGDSVIPRPQSTTPS